MNDLKQRNVSSEESRCEGHICGCQPGAHPPAVGNGMPCDPYLENLFTYHAPKPGQPEKYEKLRGRAKELAYMFNNMCPPSREASLALTKLEEAVFWANAAIARHE